MLSPCWVETKQRGNTRETSGWTVSERSAREVLPIEFPAIFSQGICFHCLLNDGKWGVCLCSNDKALALSLCHS